MFHAPQSPERMIEQAIHVCQPVLARGPRRSGLSYWFDLVIKSSLIRDDIAAHIDLDRGPGIEDITRLVARSSGIKLDHSDPVECMLNFCNHSSEFGNMFLVVTNAHPPHAKLIRWLLDFSATEGPYGLARTITLLIEGSANFKEIAIDAYQRLPPRSQFSFNRRSHSSLALYLSIDDLCKAYFPQDSFLIAAWLCDIAGSDTGFLLDVLDRVRLLKEPTTSEMEAVVNDTVELGSNSRRLVEQLPTDPETLELLMLYCAGGIVPGAPPELAARSVNEAMYHSGLLEFDPVCDGYAIRSYLSARVIANYLGRADEVISQPVNYQSIALTPILSRLETFLRWVASQCSSTVSCEDVRVPNAWKAMKGSFMKSLDVAAEVKAVVGRTWDQVMPSSTSLSEVVRNRGGVGESADAILRGTTFGELAELIKEIACISNDDHTLKFINKIRNAIAHFRAVPLCDGFALLRELKKCVREATQFLNSRSDEVL